MIKSNEQLLIDSVMDKSMTTSITLLDQKFNANHVNIMVFEPCILFPPAAAWGGGGGTGG